MTRWPPRRRDAVPNARRTGPACVRSAERDGRGRRITTAPEADIRPPASEQAADGGLPSAVRRVLVSTLASAGLTTLELQVAGLPDLSLLVRTGSSRGLPELAVWPTVLPGCPWYDGLLLIATARSADAGRRTAVHDAATLISELVVADRRRAEAEALAERAVELAGIDALTTLGNRRTWRRALEEESARATRYPRCTSIVVVDLDGLKRINDEQGHAAGDAHLQRAGAAVSAASRAVDVVCRLGGDEFGLLAPETSVEGASKLAARLRAELEEAGGPASIGVATTSDADLEAAWHHADGEM